MWYITDMQFPDEDCLIEADAVNMFFIPDSQVTFDSFLTSIYCVSVEPQVLQGRLGVAPLHEEAEHCLVYFDTIDFTVKCYFTGLRFS